MDKKLVGKKKLKKNKNSSASQKFAYYFLKQNLLRL
jgi:hypothetical protein